MRGELLAMAVLVEVTGNGSLPHRASLTEHGGIGLAGPQVGWNGRVFVVNLSAEPDKPEEELVFINPTVEAPQGADRMEEGCLSLPGIRVDVDRPERIRITEDFHAPCPKCDHPLVITTDQPLQRVQCRCGRTFALDKRIGGQLCLLPCNTRATLEERRHIDRTKATRNWILYVFVAFLGILTLVATLFVKPVVVAVALVGIALF